MTPITDLVQRNDYQGVENFIKETKKKHKFDWKKHVDQGCIEATQLGNRKIVKLFLSQGFADDPYVSYDGECVHLTFFAAKVGNLPIVKLLMEKCKPVQEEREAYYLDKTVNIAVSNGYTDIVQYYLEHGGRATCGFLAQTAKQGHGGLVQLFLEHGEKVSEAIYCNYHDYSTKLAKSKSEGEKKELVDQYAKSVKLLLDFALGTNFQRNLDEIGLDFLHKLDVSGFNFVGVSIEGKPITRKHLEKINVTGIEHAIVTREDLENLEDLERRNALKERLEVAQQSQGKIESDEGIINLVPLAYAAESGDVETVKIRLEKTNDPNQKTDFANRTQFGIEEAAKNDHLEVVKILASHPAINPDSLISAYEIARDNKHTDITEFLMSVMDVNRLDRNGVALIHKAVRPMYKDEIKKLVTAGADINLEPDAGTPLMTAAEVYGNQRHQLFSESDHQEVVELLKFLVSLGADPNKFKNYFSSPLFQAANSLNIKAVEYLLPLTDIKGLSISLDKFESKYGRPPLPWYVPLLFCSTRSNRWLEILRLLKKNDVGFTTNVAYESKTPVSYFFRNNVTFEEISELMSAGRKAVNAAKRDNIMLAIQNGVTRILDTLDFLFQNEANPHSVDRYGDSSLHTFITAVKTDLPTEATNQVIERLLKSGIPVDVLNSTRKTPLHYAVIGSNSAAVAYLINRGANVNALTKSGESPLTLAESAEIKELLRKAGAM